MTPSSRRERILRKIEERIAPPVDGSECRLWTGPTSGEGRGGGYPRMSLDGQTVAVHRVFVTHHLGYIPSKKQIDHKCQNRLCLNLDHLEIVTHKKNQKRRADAAKRKKCLSKK